MKVKVVNNHTAAFISRSLQIHVDPLQDADASVALALAMHHGMRGMCSMSSSIIMCTFGSPTG
jgi:hypothetical protein